ncbi:hypothetical protein BST81_05760 [Leptolyngbya sp. 'hensonii']|nr:hypothetical protein BST81_05760 [Leptolyngbya sp. 'hensonii']
MLRGFAIGGLGLLTLLLLAYLGLCWQRPPRTPLVRQIFQGVIYAREILTTPRPVVIHVVTLDLKVPGLKVLVTPGDPAQGGEVLAQTTTEFLQRYGLQLAINGGYFRPFYSHTPLDYYPHSGDPVRVIGLAMSNGIPYAEPGTKEPVLCIRSDNRAEIRRVYCSPETVQALSGNFMLLERGVPIAPRDHYVEPRTFACVDITGYVLHLFLVDGRQPFYSEGLKLSELSELARGKGCDMAMNLDGGGSTTLVVAEISGPRLLNAPIHTRIPLRQRAVANHLGIYAQPVPGI